MEEKEQLIMVYKVLSPDCSFCYVDKPLIAINLVGQQTGMFIYQEEMTKEDYDKIKN